ncbi:hypothetical protein GYMLUDRAFT_67582 [Collybiopsis luxurians FD-317 M1]|nr:hypothetical protein GYMLUDRAFT_67582 [Collybiopsis luxurians FD-317 M1]
MHEASSDNVTLPVYQLHPPEWLPKTHSTADLGYPNFHPPRPGQDEDILSETNVKEGLTLLPVIQAETYSSQTSISKDLRSINTIHKLEDLMNEVFARRAKQIPPIPSSTFRMPSRVTLNDVKRQAWFDDLANPDVPLAKLGRNVPHGAKGADLIDLLHSKNVAIHRAVWFLRVFGANETAGLRNKPSYNPTQYSAEWTNVVTAHLRKQLMDIALPSAPRAGVNIKQTFKGVLADPETRSKWISRFSYCLELLRLFYSEGLVDKRTFFSWLVNQMSSCNLAQAGFVSRLADEYFDGMIECRPLARPFVDASLIKLSEINTSGARHLLADTEYLIKFLLQRVCLVLPDAFVSPRMWTAYSDIIRDVLTINPNSNHPDGSVEQIAGASMFNIIYRNFLEIKRRIEAMLFRNLPSLTTSPHLGSAVHDVELLNSISADTDVVNLPFFPPSPENVSGISEKLDALLTWSVTPLQYGDHRAFAAVTLIQQWRTKAGDRANRRDASPPDEFLQDQLFEWLDSSDVAGDPGNIAAVALLYGKLVKHELFSYASYIQRLIARGELGLSSNEGTSSRHGNYLRWIPLYNTTPSLTSQRKVVIYGVRARETPEDMNEREIRKQIRAVLPELFGGTAELALPSPRSLFDSCKLLLDSPRYEQVRTFGTWLMPVLQKAIESDVSHSSILKSYGVAVELMTQTKCFDAMLDLTIYMLEHCSTEELLLAVIDTFRRHAIIWASMDVKGTIIAALDSVHHSWKMRGIQSRPLLALLVEFDSGRYLSEMSREEVRTDLAAFTLALQPVAHQPDSVPDNLPEIFELMTNVASDAPSILANGLWIKYRMTLDWGWKVWDNTMASLRQIPAFASDTEARRSCAVRYGIFLYHVNRHLASGFDDQVLGWFLERGKDQVAVLTQDVWDIVKIVLLHLVVHGALRTTTILEGLVWPAWHRGAYLSGEPTITLDLHLSAANDLFRRLLLKEDCSSDMIPPTNLLEVHCIRTRRQDVYREPQFPSMIANVPILVSLENNPRVPEQLRHDAEEIRQLLCEDKLFRQAVFRNLDAVRIAFEKSMEGNDDDIFRPTIAALSMILGESTEELELSHWPDSASLLSPWKISATAIQLQFMLRQMGKNNTDNAKSTGDSAALDKLTTMIFHHTLSSEEASFVAQMTKGVGSEIAGKFINNGLKQVADIIHNMTFTSDTLLACLSRAGELLRVLTYIAEPIRDNPSDLPQLDATVQTELFEALSTKFADLVDLFQSDSQPCDAPLLMNACIHLARFLQFDLAFRGVWTESAKSTSEALSSNLFHLVQIYASGSNSALIAFPVLLDTLFYLRDDSIFVAIEMPIDLKLGNFDPFQYYPDIPASSLPSDLAPEARKKLLSILPYFPSVASVKDLSNAHRDANGNFVIDTPVLNRPWEWTENLGDPAGDMGQGEVIKNSASLNLLSFGARMTGEKIPPDIYRTDPRILGNLRTFEDSFSEEGLFQRDWRESRVKQGAEDLSDAEVSKARTDEYLAGGTGRGDRRGTSKGSPTVSTSGASRSSGVSVRPSPDTDIIDVDAIPAGKRKAESDDEVVFVEGPVAAPKAGKKAKSAKTQAKKSTKRR